MISHVLTRYKKMNAKSNSIFKDYALIILILRTLRCIQHVLMLIWNCDFSDKIEIDVAQISIG